MRKRLANHQSLPGDRTPSPRDRTPSPRDRALSVGDRAVRDRASRIACPTLVIAGCISLATLLGMTRTASAYTPESPIVKEMVARGLAFIEAQQSDEKVMTGMARQPTYPGSMMLAAYTHHKVQQDPSHAVVQRGLAIARELAESVRRQGGLRYTAEITYECSVALLLMIDVDPQGFAEEIQYMGNALIATQKPHGGFGYLNESQGDTSQTQYCVLAMWTMDQAEFDVPKPAMSAAVQWLLRTQDPSGQWGYKGKPSPRIGARVQQDERQSHSLTTAGAGSVLIGGDFFGLWRSAKSMKPKVEGLPTALKELKDVEELKKKRASFNIPDSTLLQFIGLTENYLGNNPYRRIPWHYYYIYTLERYKSFLEVARGSQEKEPAWYNQVVENLRQIQGADGSWGDPSTDKNNTDSQISTSLAVLFLIRSTKKAIGDLGEGVLAGGYGLPSDTSEIRMEGTQVKAPASQVAVNDLLSLLEGDGPGKLDSNSIPENLKLASDPKERQQQLARLKRVVRGSESFMSRRVATRLLAQSDSLEAVPTLIFALTDPDTVARRYARDGLRFISRRFTGFGLPSDPDETQVRQAVKDWKNWYLQFDPGYVFLD